MYVFPCKVTLVQFPHSKTLSVAVNIGWYAGTLTHEIRPKKGWGKNFWTFLGLNFFKIQEIYNLGEKFSLSFFVGWWVVDFLFEHRWAAYIVRSIFGHFLNRAQRKTYLVS